MPNEAPSADSPQAASEVATAADSSLSPSASSASGAASGEPARSSPPKAKDLADLKKQRHAIAQHKRELAADRAALAKEREQFGVTNAARERELAELRSKIDAWEKGNPLERVASTGGDPAAAIRDYVEKTAPERQIEEIQKKLDAADKRDAETRKLIEAKEQEFRKAQDDARAAQMDQALKSERAGFVRTLRSQAKAYPHVHSEYSDAELEHEVRQIQDWARTVKWRDDKGQVRTGKQVSFEEAAKFLDGQAKARYDEREQRRKSVLEAAAEEASATQGRVPGPGNGRRANGPAPRTAPTPPRKLTADEERELDLRMLRQAQEKDRLANGRKST